MMTGFSLVAKANLLNAMNVIDMLGGWNCTLLETTSMSER